MSYLNSLRRQCLSKHLPTNYMLPSTSYFGSKLSNHTKLASISINNKHQSYTFGTSQSQDETSAIAKTHPLYEHLDGTYFHSVKERLADWKDSIENPEQFWGDLARKNIDWYQDFDKVTTGGFDKGDICWFLNGKLNVCYNCVDRWVDKQPDEIALIWEGNEPGETIKYTYRELLHEVCKFANVLKRQGIKKGDPVIIYLPMIPQAMFAMLACARIGAVHSVIFAGFSHRAIRDRVNDANARFVITCNEGFRGKKRVPLKDTVDRGLLECPQVEKVLVWNRTDTEVAMKPGRDVNLNEEVEAQRPYTPCEIMDAEDTLFLLYTSGSTGRPKSILHTQGGYITYTHATHKYVFDIHPKDVYACVADVGWITGHSYIVYGPLSNGATTVMFESVPTYPDAGRFWDLVERHKITQFYTAPTAIRTLMKFGDEYVTKYDRSSLKVLGSVGEPINPEAWQWYHDVVGNKQCSIVDTYWQTETGGIIITPLPGAQQLKPGAATLPFFGINPTILDKETFQEITEPDKEGLLVVKQPWPSVARTIYGNHQRYLKTYTHIYPGYFDTGDGAKRDKDGYFWITGRVDDVVNVSGHRMGTAEVEAVVTECGGVSEAAVVGVPHDVKGQVLFVYVIPKEGVSKDAMKHLDKDVRHIIRDRLGPVYTPDHVMVVTGLPKTRSGKIMRRILRKIAALKGLDTLGDTSTLANAEIVDELIVERRKMEPKED